MATHAEALLISAVIQSGEYQLLAKHNITPSLFHVHADEAEWMVRYIATNGKAPSKAALKHAYPKFVLYKVDDTEHFCDEVKKTHKRQALVDLCDTVLDSVDAGDEDTALGMIRTGAVKIEAATRGMTNDFDVFENWEYLYDDVKTRVDKVRLNGYAGVPTGFKTFDDITGGVQGGWFGVIAARLGEGKTWTGIRMGYAAAVTGHKTLYFSLEQSKRQIGFRVHAFASRQFAAETFNPMDLMRGNGFDLLKYRKFVKDLKDNHGGGQFIVNDTSRGIVTVDTVAAAIETEQPNTVIIDYLTLMGTTSDDWRGTAKISSGLQSVAQKYDVPVTALSQVNRLAIGKEPPGTENLSQADAIGQDADWVLTTKRHGQSVQRMYLPKFRHGQSGQKWWAKFSPGTGEYDEIDPQTASDIIDAEMEED